MRRIVYILLPILVIFIVGFVYFKDRHSKAEPVSLSPPQKYNDSLTKLAIIGDSWVSDQKLDSLLEKELGFGVISFGHPGGTTRQIYQDLLGEASYILHARPEYCLVIAGVNDAAQHLGPEYYEYHLSQIVALLQAHEITPIIMELPEFGVVELYESMDVLRKTRLYVSSYFYNDGNIDNISDYRDMNLEVIPFELCDDFSNCESIYKDYAHLNEEGNKKFSKHIAKCLEPIVKDDQEYSSLQTYPN